MIATKQHTDTAVRILSGVFVLGGLEIRFALL